MKTKWVGMGLLLLATFSLAACGGSGGGGVPAAGTAPGTVGVQGNLVGQPAPAAALSRQVALAGDTTVLMFDEAGTKAAEQVVSPVNGQFSLSVPEGHDYVMVFRDAATGKTLGILTPDATGLTTISLPAGAADLNLGNIELDPKTGKARCLSQVTVAHAAKEFTDTDGDGIPDVCDDSANQDGDLAADMDDAFPFDAAEWLDTDGDKIGNIADADDDGDGVADDDDDFPLLSSASVDTDEDGMPDSATATQAQKDLMIAQGLTPDPDDDNDGNPNGNDPNPGGGTFAIPTDRTPSPLYGALPFEQQMLRFEEFGTESLPDTEAANWAPLPAPANAHSIPDPSALEAFLAQDGLSPYPTRLANGVLDTDTLDDPDAKNENPWKAQIEAFLGRVLDTPPAEGRPWGEFWAHQRWDEFYPEVYYKTCLAGARLNEGFRDSRQLHGYSVGEFGPDGLYHKVYNAPGVPADAFNGTTNGLPIKFHPNMPVQDPQALWTFDGTLPPKLLMARYGQTVLMRNYNALPIDPIDNFGFGANTISTHEHNGHTPAESDGYTQAYFYPGQYYDYRWPLQLAGYDSINTNANEPRAAFPCVTGETLMVDDDGDGIPTEKQCTDGRIQLRGDWRETMSTHWFHDHMLDATAQNVYKGNAVMMNYYSALDRGNEQINDGVNLRFPSGTALPWGNRDYDVNLVIADKAWGQLQNGQLWFNTANLDGFLGDQVLVNWLYKPYFDVRARKYRFRILDGAVSRYFALALVHQVQGDGGEMPGPAGSGVSYNRVPFHMIANDGNIMEHAIPFDGSMNLNPNNPNPAYYRGQLPSQGIAERYDIIVDFSQFQPGDKLYLVNIMEHKDGKGVEGRIPLADVLSEAYKATLVDDNQDGVFDRYVDGDPGVGKILEIRVHEYSGTDLSMNPADYEPGKLKMIPLPINRNDPAVQAQLQTAIHHTFEFVRSQGGSLHPWQIKVDGGNSFPMDSARVSALIGDQVEVWSIFGGGGWDHPVHVHFEEGVVLSRDNKEPPVWEQWARKDLYRIGRDDESTREISIAYRARDFIGTYMEHCHNTQHEDHAMLLRWDAQNPGNLVLLPAIFPGWDGVEYGASFLGDTAADTGRR